MLFNCPDCDFGSDDPNAFRKHFLGSHAAGPATARQAPASAPSARVVQLLPRASGPTVIRAPHSSILRTVAPRMPAPPASALGGPRAPAPRAAAPVRLLFAQPRAAPVRVVVGSGSVSVAGSSRGSIRAALPPTLPLPVPGSTIRLPLSAVRTTTFLPTGPGNHLKPRWLSGRSASLSQRPSVPIVRAAVPALRTANGLRILTPRAPQPDPSSLPAGPKPSFILKCSRCKEATFDSYREGTTHVKRCLYLQHLPTGTLVNEHPSDEGNSVYRSFLTEEPAPVLVIDLEDENQSSAAEPQLDPGDAQSVVVPTARGRRSGEVDMNVQTDDGASMRAGPSGIQISSPAHGTTKAKDADLCAVRQVFCCRICTYWSSTVTRFYTHMCVHTGEHPYRCSNCDFTARGTNEILDHLKLQHLPLDLARGVPNVLVADMIERFKDYISNAYVSVKAEQGFRDPNDEFRQKRRGHLLPRAAEPEDPDALMDSETASSSQVRPVSTSTVKSDAGASSGLRVVPLESMLENPAPTSTAGIIPLSAIQSQGPVIRRIVSAIDLQRALANAGSIQKNPVVVPSQPSRVVAPAQPSRVVAPAQPNPVVDPAQPSPIVDPTPPQDRKTLWKCKKCHFRDRDKDVVVSHIREHYDREHETTPPPSLPSHAPKTFECGFCTLVSAYKHVIKRHCRSKHGRVFILAKETREVLEDDGVKDGDFTFASELPPPSPPPCVENADERSALASREELSAGSSPGLLTSAAFEGAHVVLAPGGVIRSVRGASGMLTRSTAAQKLQGTVGTSAAGAVGVEQTESSIIVIAKSRDSTPGTSSALMQSPPLEQVTVTRRETLAFRGPGSGSPHPTLVISGPGISPDLDAEHEGGASPEPEPELEEEFEEEPAPVVDSECEEPAPEAEPVREPYKSETELMELVDDNSFRRYSGNFYCLSCGLYEAAREHEMRVHIYYDHILKGHRVFVYGVTPMSLYHPSPTGIPSAPPSPVASKKRSPPVREKSAQPQDAVPPVTEQAESMDTESEAFPAEEEEIGTAMEERDEEVVIINLPEARLTREEAIRDGFLNGDADLYMDEYEEMMGLNQPQPQPQPQTESNESKESIPDPGDEPFDMGSDDGHEPIAGPSSAMGPAAAEESDDDLQIVATVQREPESDDEGDDRSEASSDSDLLVDGEEELSPLKKILLLPNPKNPNNPRRRISYLCRKCPSSFSGANSLKLHTKNHGASCRFTCPMCDYSVTTLNNLNRHIAIHEKAAAEQQQTEEEGTGGEKAISKRTNQEKKHGEDAMQDREVAENLSDQEKNPNEDDEMPGYPTVGEQNPEQKSTEDEKVAGERTVQDKTPEKESIDCAETPSERKVGMTIPETTEHTVDEKASKQTIEEKKPERKEVPAVRTRGSVRPQKEAVEKKRDPVKGKEEPVKEAVKNMKGGKVVRKKNNQPQNKSDNDDVLDDGEVFVPDTRVRCKRCPMTMATLRHLASHMRQHGGDNKLKCRICDYTSNSCSSMTLHRQLHRIAGDVDPAETLKSKKNGGADAEVQQSEASGKRSGRAKQRKRVEPAEDGEPQRAPDWVEKEEPEKIPKPELVQNRFKMVKILTEEKDKEMVKDENGQLVTIGELRARHAASNCEYCPAVGDSTWILERHCQKHTRMRDAVYPGESSDTDAGDERNARRGREDDVNENGRPIRTCDACDYRDVIENTEEHYGVHFALPPYETMCVAGVAHMGIALLDDDKEWTGFTSDFSQPRPEEDGNEDFDKPSQPAAHRVKVSEANFVISQTWIDDETEPERAVPGESKEEEEEKVDGAPSVDHPPGLAISLPEQPSEAVAEDEEEGKHVKPDTDENFEPNYDMDTEEERSSYRLRRRGAGEVLGLELNLNVLCEEVLPIANEEVIEEVMEVGHEEVIEVGHEEVIEVAHEEVIEVAHEEVVGNTEENENALLLASLIPLPAVSEQDGDTLSKPAKISSRHFVRPRADEEWETESEAEFTDGCESVSSSSSDEDDDPPAKKRRMDEENKKSTAQRAKESEEEQEKRIKEEELYMRFRVATLGADFMTRGRGAPTLEQGVSSSGSENDTVAGTD